MRKTIILVAAVAAVSVSGCGPSGDGGGNGRTTETYRLIHAIGNAENEVARDLTRSECERRRDDLKVTATALGTYNEATGYGSITCLPESFF